MKNKDRLIKRMCLACELTATIAFVGLIATFSPKLKDVAQSQSQLIEQKQDIISDFIETENFRASYNHHLNNLNTQLQNKIISSKEYCEQLEYLNSQDFAEKVALDYLGFEDREQLLNIYSQQKELDTKALVSALSIGIGSIGPSVLLIDLISSIISKNSSNKKEQDKSSEMEVK